MGLLLTIVVHGAEIQDRDGAKLVLRKLRGRFPRLQRIWADSGYAGALVEWAAKVGRWALDIIKRPTGQKGFIILPRRWVVERTFGWFGKYRRLSKDYETLPESSEAMIHIAMINLMIHRLVPG